MSESNKRGVRDMGEIILLSRRVGMIDQEAGREKKTYNHTLQHRRDSMCQSIVWHRHTLHYCDGVAHREA